MRMSEPSDSEPRTPPAVSLPIAFPEDDASPASALELEVIPPGMTEMPAAAPVSATEIAQSVHPLAAPADAPRAMPATPRTMTPLRRLTRLVAGMALLAVGWGFLLVLIVLVSGVWTFLHGARPMLVRASAGVGTALVAAWLALAVVACVLAGAYSLMLTFARRRW